jgi:hypothetical protein
MASIFVKIKRIKFPFLDFIISMHLINFLFSFIKINTKSVQIKFISQILLLEMPSEITMSSP